MKELNEFIKKYQKKEYDPTGMEGANCFSMVIDWLDLETHGDINSTYTHKNLNTHWKQDNIKTVKAMIEHYAPYVDKIPKVDMRIGDIVLLREKTGFLAPAIFSGNSKIFTIIKQGGYHIKLNHFEIVEVFRKI